jgi:sterol desaturase/sphingolipid hydroxylase (fatty acid hydroxylase superfamily)
MERFEINYNKPMLEQVGQLREFYNDWVYQPQTQINNFRMFRSDFIEYFSKTPWYIIPLFWGPYVLFLLTEAIIIIKNTNECISFGLSILGGAMTWTLVEYLLHRFVFHLISKSIYPTLLTIHFLLHGQHHKFPNDTGRLVFPIVPSVILWLGFQNLFAFYLLPTLLPSFSAGFVLAYIFYDMIHYYIHHGNPTNTYIRNLKISHMRHHYKNPTREFGISFKLWDYIF